MTDDNDRLPIEQRAQHAREELLSDGSDDQSLIKGSSWWRVGEKLRLAIQYYGRD